MCEETCWVSDTRMWALRCDAPELSEGKKDLAPTRRRRHGNKWQERNQSASLIAILFHRLWRLLSQFQCQPRAHLQCQEVKLILCKWDHHPSVFSSRLDLIYILFSKKNVKSRIYLLLQSLTSTCQFWGNIQKGILWPLRVLLDSDTKKWDAKLITKSERQLPAEPFCI